MLIQTLDRELVDCYVASVNLPEEIAMRKSMAEVHAAGGHVIHPRLRRCPDCQGQERLPIAGDTVLRAGVAAVEGGPLQPFSLEPGVVVDCTQWPLVTVRWNAGGHDLVDYRRLLIRNELKAEVPTSLS